MNKWKTEEEAKADAAAWYREYLTNLAEAPVDVQKFVNSLLFMGKVDTVNAWAHEGAGFYVQYCPCGESVCKGWKMVWRHEMDEMRIFFRPTVLV